MQKKKKKSLFSYLLLISVIIFYSMQSKAQKAIEKENCYLLAGGKKIKLFEDIFILKKSINVVRDIEYPNSQIFLYGYDAHMRKVNNYIVTPQILFFVDTLKKKTIKEQIYFNIERPTEDGKISRSDLKQIFELIRKNTVPFFLIIKDAEFGFSRKYYSACSPYVLAISKVEDEYKDKSSQQFSVTISLTNQP